MALAYQSKDMHLDSSWVIKNHLKYFTIMLLEITIYTENFSVQDHIEPTGMAYISRWIQSVIGQWLENIPYGTLP